MIKAFDAVVGNPPYDELSEHALGRDLPEKDFFKEQPLYVDAMGGRLNVFRLFILRAVTLHVQARMPQLHRANGANSG